VTQPSANDAYNLESVDIPYLAGNKLKLFISLLEGPAGKALLGPLLKQVGITDLRQQRLDDWPTFEPTAPAVAPAKTAFTLPPEAWPQQAAHRQDDWDFASAFDYARAYRQGSISPEEVAERFLAAEEASNQSDKPLRAFIELDREDVMRQARASAQRLRAGEPLSILDGVPVAIKDELDMVPFPTHMGTTFLGQQPVKQDAIAVARLRAAGALLLGKTNMHEIGIGVTGFNPHYGTPRNPYHPDHYTGGSSSGSAAAVAAGMAPIAMGADGGGSIRLPAAFCGITGLKPTYGRIPESGSFGLDFSVAHVGPLAATISDLVLAYSVLAGPDPRDRLSTQQPLPTLEGWQKLDLSDLTLGIYWPWFRHATPEMVQANEKMLAHYQQLGARIQEITLPELEAARVAHVVTITTEMNQALEPFYEAHHKDLGPDVRMSLAISRAFTARDFVLAQRVRTRLMGHFEQAFRQVDAIITPAAGLTAPIIRPGALSFGDSDLNTLTEIMRYTLFANMTGHPAIAFPVGYSAKGLPTSMQVMARHWDEVTLFRLALAAEKHLTRQKPQVYFEQLGR
jgi:Asp-tRNA(Asn)/Glu-tRNA(Gln) amidotransferase A subunit family amidase